MNSCCRAAQEWRGAGSDLGSCPAQPQCQCESGWDSAAHRADWRNLIENIENQAPIVLLAFNFSSVAMPGSQELKCCVAAKM